MLAARLKDIKKAHEEEHLLRGDDIHRQKIPLNSSKRPASYLRYLQKRAQQRTSDVFEVAEDELASRLKGRINMLAQKSCFEWTCKALKMDKKFTEKIPAEFVTPLPTELKFDVDDYAQMSTEDQMLTEVLAKHGVTEPVLLKRNSTVIFLQIASKENGEENYSWRLFHYLGPVNDSDDQCFGHFYHMSADITGLSLSCAS